MIWSLARVIRDLGTHDTRRERCAFFVYTTHFAALSPARMRLGISAFSDTYCLRTRVAGNLFTANDLACALPMANDLISMFSDLRIWI